MHCFGEGRSIVARSCASQCLLFRQGNQHRCSVKGTPPLIPLLPGAIASPLRIAVVCFIPQPFAGSGHSGQQGKKRALLLFHPYNYSMTSPCFSGDAPV